MQSVVTFTVLLTLVLSVGNTFSAPTLSPVQQELTESAQISPATIFFYAHSNYEGVKTEAKLAAPECYTLSGDQEDNYFSSIKISSGTCVKLYIDKGCRGTSKIIESNHPDFNELGINDDVTSFRKCKQSERTAQLTTVASTSETTTVTPTSTTTTMSTSTLSAMSSFNL